MVTRYDKWRKVWYKRMPILNWLPQYKVQQDLKFDLIAGFTVCAMLVPQEMSLAALMDVPAQYGLYTAAIAPLIYPLFGSSRALSVANASEGSLLVGVMLRSADIQTVEMRIATGILLTFFTGVIMVVAGLLRQGGVVTFFSRTSMNGYITATAFLIIVSQLPSWLGISLGSSKLTILSVVEILGKIPDMNLYSFSLGIFSMVVLWTAKWLKTHLQKIVLQTPNSETSESSTALSHQSDALGTESNDYKEDDEEVVEIQLDAPAQLHSHDYRSTVVPLPSNQSTAAIYKEQTGECSGVTNKRALELMNKHLKQRPYVLLLCKLLCDGGPLIVCVIGMCVGVTWGESKIHLTGKVHQGLPAPVFPPAVLGSIIPLEQLDTIILNSLTIAVIFFMSSVAIGSKLASKDGYEISPNQELLGLGFANLGASFFQGMPSSGSLSRSAVNSQNAHTPLASMITAVLVAFTILLLTRPLYYLPQAPLAAIIILSALSLIDFSELKWLRCVRKQELYVWIASFVGTLVFGLLQGLILSIAASLVAIMARTKKPRVIALGQLPDGNFAEMNHHQQDQHEQEQHPDPSTDPSKPSELLDIVILRMEQDLYFGNAMHLIHAMEKHLQHAKARGRVLGIVIDGSRINDIDATTIHLFKEYQDKLQKRDQLLTFANLKEETKDSLVAGGVGRASREEDEMKPGAHSLMRSSNHKLTDDIVSAIACVRMGSQ